MAKQLNHESEMVWKWGTSEEGGGDGKPKKQETGEMSSVWSKGDDRQYMDSKAPFLHKHKKLVKHLDYKDRKLKEQI